MAKYLALFVVFSLVILAGCGGEKQPPPPTPKPVAEKPAAPPTPSAPEKAAFVRTDGQRFVDPQGRHLLLHGLSVISKSKSENYLSWHDEAAFAQMRDWGMNCIRLGIIWDGLEPEPGKYDEAYLKGVDQRIAWAKANGLYVFLDMHQDLFSVLYSDGAPEWATLTDGKPHVAEGGVWSDAYFTSPAVQTAFDNFWANKPGPDGVGVQDRFALAWRHVAERYANEPTVIAYDLFNEPNAGGESPLAQMQLILKYGEVMAAKEGSTPLPPDKLAALWLDPAGRSEVMKKLGDMTIYTPIIDAGEPVFQEFERKKLMPMFQRVTKAIREVDTSHIIFLETSMSANMGIRSGIEPVTGADGARDPQQAYAPHGYDIVVDTADLATGSDARVELIFARHGETAARLAMPMLIGEWGAFGGAGPEILPAAQVVVRQFEKLLCSDTYWEYGRDLGKAAYLEALSRPIPVSVAGLLLSYQADPATRKFTVSWKEDPAIKEPTRIYIPALWYPNDPRIELTPPGPNYTAEPTREGSKNKCLVIPPAGQATERSLVVEPAQ